MDFLDILKDKAFLGREFLTWLWFKSEQTGTRIELSDDTVVQVVFLDRMTLDLHDAERPELVSIKGEHSGLREGIAALKKGKKINEARISLKASENEFTVIVKGTWFSFGAFTTPPILPPEEAGPDEGLEGRLLEKAALMEEGMSIIDSLFQHFLKIRISAQWELNELPAIRSWIATAED